MVPDAPLNTINTHISETLAMIDSPLAHDFSNRAGKEQRDLLREKVHNLGAEIRQINPQRLIYQEDKKGEIRTAYRQLKDSLTTLDAKISSFDKEIRKKSIPNIFIRIIFFWKTFKPEEDIPLVSNAMMTARKEFLESKVDAEGDVPKRMKAAQTPGTWALSKNRKEKITLYVKDGQKTKQYAIEVTPEGYKVNEKLFDIFTALLESVHAKVKLGESEEERVVSLIKDIHRLSDTDLLKEIEKISDHANKFRLLMKAGVQNRPALFAHIVDALGSLTNLTQEQLRQRDRAISILREKLEL